MGDTSILLRENLLRDVEELVQVIDEPFGDEDILDNEYGLDLMAAAKYFTEAYNGRIDFMTAMKSRLVTHGNLTVPMARAVLNILRKEARGESTPTKERDQLVKCYKCDAEFTSMQLLLDHKDQAHSGRAPKVEVAPGGAEFLPERVIEVVESKLKLDLSNLPDGRYAAPDLTGKNDFIFLMVRRVRKRVFRNRRYVWGKIITGQEWVEAGTIEVKIWSSDSKELIGEQKPGDVYRGKFEVELNAIMGGPNVWARIFGQNIGRCGICGKTLTDEISRSDGFGPECIKKINESYFTRKVEPAFEKKVDETRGLMRVWCVKHARFDCEERHSFYDLDDEV